MSRLTFYRNAKITVAAQSCRSERAERHSWGSRQRLSAGGGGGSNSVGSSSSNSPYEVTAYPEKMEDGSVKVGNIQFDESVVLGKGCEGTFVYK